MINRKIKVNRNSLEGLKGLVQSRARLIRKKNWKHKTQPISEMKEEILLQIFQILTIMKDYYGQLCSNKFNNLAKMSKFFENTTLQNCGHKKKWKIWIARPASMKTLNLSFKTLPQRKLQAQTALQVNSIKCWRKK